MWGFPEGKFDFSVLLRTLVTLKPGADLCVKVVAEGVVGVLDKSSFVLELFRMGWFCGAPLCDLVDALVGV